MDYSQIKKLFLRGFIGFLALSALIAIISVFYGDFGVIQARILATTFTISISSVCAMSCAAFIERRRQIALGLAGIGCSVIGAILLLLGIWSVLEGNILFKFTVTFVTISLAFAHAFLLALPELHKKHGWVQQATAATIGVLAIQIIVAAWLEIEAQIYYRFLAGVAILAGLETLIIPILFKIKDQKEEKAEVLRLTHIDGDRYKDTSGNTYEVKAVTSDATPPAR